MVTHRTRVLAALRGEQVDRLPYVPRLDLWYLANSTRGTLPPQYAGRAQNDIARAEGWALHHRFCDDQLDPVYQPQYLHRGINVFYSRDTLFDIGASEGRRDQGAAHRPAHARRVPHAARDGQHDDALRRRVAEARHHHPGARRAPDQDAGRLRAGRVPVRAHGRRAELRAVPAMGGRGDARRRPAGGDRLARRLAVPHHPARPDRLRRSSSSTTRTTTPRCAGSPSASGSCSTRNSRSCATRPPRWCGGARTSTTCSPTRPTSQQEIGPWIRKAADLAGRRGQAGALPHRRREHRTDGPDPRFGHAHRRVDPPGADDARSRSPSTTGAGARSSRSSAASRRRSCCRARRDADFEAYLDEFFRAVAPGTRMVVGHRRRGAARGGLRAAAAHRRARRARRTPAAPGGRVPAGGRDAGPGAGRGGAAAADARRRRPSRRSGRTSSSGKHVAIKAARPGAARPRRAGRRTSSSRG